MAQYHMILNANDHQLRGMYELFRNDADVGPVVLERVRQRNLVDEYDNLLPNANDVQVFAVNQPAPAPAAGDMFEPVAGDGDVDGVQQGVAGMQVEGGNVAGINALVAAGNAEALRDQARPLSRKRSSRRQVRLKDMFWTDVRQGAADPHGSFAQRFGTDPSNNPKLLARRFQAQTCGAFAARQDLVKNAKTQAVRDAMADGEEDIAELCRIARRTHKSMNRVKSIIATGQGKSNVIDAIAVSKDHARQELDPADGIPIQVCRDSHTGHKTMIVTGKEQERKEVMKEGIDPETSSWTDAKVRKCGLCRDFGCGINTTREAGDQTWEAVANEPLETRKAQYKAANTIVCTPQMAVIRLTPTYDEEGNFVRAAEWNIEDFDVIVMDEMDVLGQQQEEDGREAETTMYSFNRLYELLGETALFFYFSGTCAAWMDHMPDLVTYNLGDAFRDRNMCQFNLLELVPEGMVLRNVEGNPIPANEAGVREWTCVHTNPADLTDRQKQWLREHPDALKAYFKTWIANILMEGDEERDGSGLMFQGVVFVPKEGRRRGGRENMVLRVVNWLKEVIEVEGAGDLFPPMADYKANPGGVGILVVEGVYAGMDSKTQHQVIQRWKDGHTHILVGDEITRRGLDNAWCKFELCLRKHEAEEPEEPAHDASAAEWQRFRKETHKYRQSESSLGQAAGRESRKLYAYHATNRRAHLVNKLAAWIQRYEGGHQPCWLTMPSVLQNVGTFARYLARYGASEALNVMPQINVVQVMQQFNVQPTNDDEEYVAMQDMAEFEDTSSEEGSDGSESSDDGFEPPPQAPPPAARRRPPPVARPSRRGVPLTDAEIAQRAANRQRQNSERAAADARASRQAAETTAQRDRDRAERRARLAARNGPLLEAWGNRIPTVTCFLSPQRVRMFRITVEPLRTGEGGHVAVFASTHGRADAHENVIRQRIALPLQGDVIVDVPYDATYKRLRIGITQHGANQSVRKCAPCVLTRAANEVTFTQLETEMPESAPAQVAGIAAPAGGAASVASAASVVLPPVRPFAIELLPESRQRAIASILDGIMLDAETYSDFNNAAIARLFANSGHANDSSSAPYIEIFHAICERCKLRNEAGDIIEGHSPVETIFDEFEARLREHPDHSNLLMPDALRMAQAEYDAAALAALPDETARNQHFTHPYFHADPRPENEIGPLFDADGNVLGQNFPLIFEGIGYTQEGLLNIFPDLFERYMAVITREASILRDDEMVQPVGAVSTAVLPCVSSGGATTRSSTTATTTAPLTAATLAAAGAAGIAPPTIPTPAPATATRMGDLQEEADVLRACDLTSRLAAAPTADSHAYRMEQNQDGQLSLGTRTMLQSVEVSMRNGQPIQRRPGQRHWSDQQPAPQPAPQPPAGEHVAPNPRTSTGGGRQPTALGIMGNEEKALVRAAFPHDFNDERDQLFKDRLMAGGTFNGRRVSRITPVALNPQRADGDNRTVEERRQAAAQSKLSKVYRGVWISGIVASEHDEATYPAPTPRTHLYDFLEKRGGKMVSGGALEKLSLEQKWVNEPGPRGASGSNDMASHMLLYKDVMFPDECLVRSTFNQLDTDTEGAYYDLLVGGAAAEAVDREGAYRDKQVFYKGVAIIIKAKDADAAFAFTRGGNFTTIMRNSIEGFYTDGELTAWALEQGLIGSQEDGPIMRSAIENFIDNIDPGDVDGRRFHLHGSPPCQRFSKINQKGRKEGDRKHAINLVEWFIDYALASSATSWSMEQVAQPDVVAVVERKRKEYGRKFTYAVLRLEELGVPQTRVRLVAGTPRLIAKLLRAADEQPRRSARCVIAKPRGTHIRGTATGVGKRKKARAVAGEAKYTYKRAKWNELCRTIDEPAPTVVGRHALTWVTGNGEGINRSVLYPSELAALQTFPPGYKLPSNKYQAYLQIGNAVPPRVAELMLRGE